MHFHPSAPRLLVAVALASFVLASCSGGGDTPVPDNAETPTAAVCTPGSLVNLPVDFPEPEVPCNNTLNADRIALGRLLFFDRNLSFNQTQSCADCHQPASGFTDGLNTSVGSEGGIHPRNAMSLTNVVYNSTMNWANPLVTNLHQQALAVLLNDAPIELGWDGHEEDILSRLRAPDAVDYSGTPFAVAAPDYPAMFAAAFADDADPFTIFNVTLAIEAFEVTMISGNSEFDREQRGEANAMSDAAKAGRELFFSERLECFHCHGGINFSDSINHAGTVFTQASFHNNGLYNIDVTGDGIGDGNFPAGNQGLFEETLLPEDKGKFRAPTLRNIELTAPYMHDGSIASLDEVIDHYSAGGRTIDAPDPNAGNGSLSPNKSPLLAGFVITANERLDLIEFFRSLTDWEFICNPDFSDPFGNLPMHANCP